ncbi:MAG: AbrB/MazE/SpoVT family DNA-binding domain-containing protein [Spirochaetia bacterium]|nr:AbrB/MazE/SpoVT family DNA-binding domain-containing protein [Spirochaetia bacterium]
MKTKLVDIGNSKGIRIPKSFIEKCQLKNELELDLVDDTIIIKKYSGKIRSGWREAFEKMNKNNEDVLIAGNITDSFEKDWEW